MARSTGRGHLCPGCRSLRGGVNLAPSPSLSTRNLCSPHFLPLWHAGVCRCWFDISVLCQSSLLPDGCYCSQLLQGKPRTLQVTWAIIYCHIQFHQSLCWKRTPAGFDDLFSHAGLKTHAAEWAVLVSWVWEFGISYYCLLQRLFNVTPTLTLLLAWNSPLSHFWLCKIHRNRQTLV